MKNHLFIGLGGQGGKSLAELRKVIEQRQTDAEYLRKNDIRWDHLYIDSSLDVTNTRANWTHFGKSLALDPADFVYLKENGQNPSAAQMRQRPDVAPWLGDPAIVDGFLQGAAQIQGANQRRRFGRLLFANHADKIRTAIIDEKVEKLTQARLHQCCFHIFASLAGGTGSGSIVDLVTMLRSRYPDSSTDRGFPIFLYLYVTSEDVGAANVGFFHENQYSALRDLNALACGRLQINLLGSRNDHTVFSHQDTFNGIVLSSSLNDRNQKLSLKRQHQILAESAFERIYCYCSGNLNEDQQKALTGEDILVNFSGEPRFRPQRSYRFGTMGMRRWEIPTEQVQQLLANELYVSSFRQMLYENWQDNSGYLGYGSSTTTGAFEFVLRELRNLVENTLTISSEMPQLAKDLEKDFTDTFIGLAKDGFKGLLLSDIEATLNERYQRNLRAKGVDALFNDLALLRQSRLETLRQKVHDLLKAAWLNPSAPLGIGYVQQLLTAFQEELRQRLQSDPKSNSSVSDRIKSRISARHKEWDKITFVSAFKRKPLVEAHVADLKSMLTADLKQRAAKEDEAFLNLLVGETSSLAQRYHGAGEKLKKYEQLAQEQSEVFANELRNLNGDDSANKYELDLKALDAFRMSVRVNKTHMRNTAEMLRREIETMISAGTLADLKELQGAREEMLWEKLDALCYDRVRAIHDDLLGKGATEPILGSSLLSRLESKQTADPEAFLNELSHFISLAASSTRISRGEMQPSTLSGVKQPPMPQRMLVFGLPRNHAFSDKLIELSSRLQPPDVGLKRGTYFHDDPTQLRLLVVDSWMAARFALVVAELEGIYTRALNQDPSGEVAYFTNIDGEGEKNKRPAMLLPTPAQSQKLLIAQLRLGRMLHNESIAGGPSNELLIQSNESGLYLVQETPEGAKTTPLGASEEQVLKTADIRLMTMINDTITNALSKLDSKAVEELKSRVDDMEGSIRQKGGTLSEEYIAWTPVREEIHRILAL